MQYDCLHSKFFTVTLVRCELEADVVRCGTAAFMANLPDTPTALFDFWTGEQVCVIVIPEAATGMPTPEAWADAEMGDLIDIDRADI